MSTGEACQWISTAFQKSQVNSLAIGKEICRLNIEIQNLYRIGPYFYGRKIKKSKMVIFDSPAAKGFETRLKKGKTSIGVIIDKNGKVIKNTGKKENERAEKVKK